MKGGDVLALGVLRALAARAGDLGEAALLLVNDEEWRLGRFGHVQRFAGWDACLCFEAGELDPGSGEDAVVVRRKAAGTVKVVAQGRSAHSGSAPDKGVNALLAAAAAAQAVAGVHAPAGAGPPHGRADGPAHRRGVQRRPGPTPSSSATCAPTAARPSTGCSGRSRRRSGEATLSGGAASASGRGWTARAATAPLLDAAGALLGRPVAARRARRRERREPLRRPRSRSPSTVSGPRGGGAHAVHEHVLEPSVRPRAEVALGLRRRSWRADGSPC